MAVLQFLKLLFHLQVLRLVQIKLLFPGNCVVLALKIDFYAVKLLLFLLQDLFPFRYPLEDLIFLKVMPLKLRHYLFAALYFMFYLHLLLSQNLGILSF